MWLEKSKDKFRVCDRYTDPLTGLSHKVGVTMEKDTPQQRNIARKKLDILIAKRQSITPDVMHLSDLVKLYLDDLKNTVKLSTLTRNKYACDRFLKMLGDCDINKLTAGIVKQRIIAYNNKPTTVNEHITRFKALMRWAYRNDYIKDISWLDKLTKLKDKTEREKVADKYLEREECAALLDAMSHEQWRNLTQFLILSGLRIGEALALNESDLDFSNREISVTKTLDLNNGIVTTTKTLSSTRQVYMQDDLYAFCRALVRSNKRKRKMLYLNRSPLYFTPTGAYGSYNAYLKYLKATAARVLDKEVTPHTLRHTHASILAELSIDNPKITLDFIRRRLGHSNSRITEDIYIHITEKRKEKENESLKAIKII